MAGLRLQKELVREDDLLRGFLGEIESRLKAPIEAAGALTGAIIEIDFQIRDLTNRLAELSDHEMRGTIPPLAGVKPEEVPGDCPGRNAIEFMMALNAEHRRTNLYNSTRPKCIDEVNAALVGLGAYRESLTSTRERLIRLATRMQRLGVANTELERQLALRTQGVQHATTGVDRNVDHLQKSLWTYHALAAQRDELLAKVNAKEHSWIQG